MKKLLFIFAIGTMLVLNACGEKSTTTNQSDSVSVDTTESLTDSTALPADTIQLK